MKVQSNSQMHGDGTASLAIDEWAYRKWLGVFLLLALLRGSLYLVVVPPWQHPDEPTHFEHVRIIAERGALPAPDFVSLPMRREIADSMVQHAFWRGIPQPALNNESLATVGISPLGIYTLTQPKLYYVLAALWLRPWLEQSVDVQLYAVRFLSVLLNLIVVASAFFTARFLFPSDLPLVVAVVGFVVFQPTLTDIMSSSNNDVLGNAFAAAFFCATAWIYQRGLTLGRGMLAILLLTGALLSKTTAVAVIAAFPIGLAFYPWRGKSHFISVFGVAAIAFVGLGGIGFVLNEANNPLVQKWLTVAGQYFRMDVLGTWQAITAPDLLEKKTQTAIIVFQSFWAVFGWRHVGLATEWYWLPLIASLTAIGGLVWCAVSWWRTSKSSVPGRTRAYLAFAAVAVLFSAFAAVVRSDAVQGMAPYFSHGRYIFVAIVPFAILFTIGLERWLAKLFQRKWWIVFLVALASFEAIGFWGHLVPFYYR